jgi:anti-sigma factor RsiW
MSDCQYHSRLDAYYDGELGAAEADRITRHLAECESCSAAVARLREMSQAMAQFQPASISQIELARLHRNLDGSQDRSLLRFSTALATMAASVLIISLTWITQTSGVAPRSLPANSPDSVEPWYRMAMGEPVQNPTMNNNLGLPDSGVATIPDRETIKWMLDSVQ